MTTETAITTTIASLLAGDAELPLGIREEGQEILSGAALSAARKIEDGNAKPMFRLALDAGIGIPDAIQEVASLTLPLDDYAAGRAARWIEEARVLLGVEESGAQALADSYAGAFARMEGPGEGTTAHDRACSSRNWRDIAARVALLRQRWPSIRPNTDGWGNKSRRFAADGWGSAA